ncbi:hypothetical protein TgHK011_003855 [Trichoderma gracile]|nr:hypothetical protein TgHK011_003855 [Trichoderma gracile]
MIAPFFRGRRADAVDKSRALFALPGLVLFPASKRFEALRPCCSAVWPPGCWSACAVLLAPAEGLLCCVSGSRSESLARRERRE